MGNKYLLMTIAVSIIAISSLAQVTGTFTDSRDGKIYKLIIIGTQTWMAANVAFKTDSGCWAYNDDISNVTTYGYLYNWETAKNVCPIGFHLPTDAEWTILTTYLGGEIVAGSKLKKTGTTHWQSPNAGATNETGFTALPGGSRGNNGKFGGIGGDGFWWSSTEFNTFDAWYRGMLFDYSHVFRFTYSKSYGLSVRCMRD